MLKISAYKTSAGSKMTLIGYSHTVKLFVSASLFRLCRKIAFGGEGVMEANQVNREKMLQILSSSHSSL